MTTTTRSTAPRSYLFTSESVTEGHPDKICDQVSDAILDALLTKEAQLQAEGYVAPSGTPANVDNVRCACETFVTTGTVVVAGEVRTEADAMAEYLVEHGLDEGRITKEERSSTTAENLRFSSALLEPGAEVGVVTNDFHLYRALRIAERNGLPGAHGLAAPSNPLYLPQAMLRECVAVVKDALFGNM